MPSRPTVVLFVHGANRSALSRAANRQAWVRAFRAERENALRLVPVLRGWRNRLITEHHRLRHPRSRWPAYRGWRAAWYGGVWREVAERSHQVRFARRLNPSREIDLLDRRTILERIEREVMERHFDELVPFYELAVRQDTGRTLYESICRRLLEDLFAATLGGALDYVLVAHSMGCAVAYNVMTHLGRLRAGQPVCPLPGTLSEGYRARARRFLDLGARCFGLLTFGNYTAYDWCQRMNHRLLFGCEGRVFVYPEEVARWRNFWTALGGDPLILDDMLAGGMVAAGEDRFQDLVVWRPPFVDVGHGLGRWFRRDDFVWKLAAQLERHLYN